MFSEMILVKDDFFQFVVLSDEIHDRTRMRVIQFTVREVNKGRPDLLEEGVEVMDLIRI